MKKTIIIGASSGIGRELAFILAEDQYRTGLAARRLDELEKLSNLIHGESYCVRMDVAQPEQVLKQFNTLIQLLGGADLVIICAGTGHINPELEWEPENETIEIDVKEFTCIADAAMRCFIRQDGGHLVAISSVAALRGSGISPRITRRKRICIITSRTAMQGAEGKRGYQGY